MTGRPGHRTSKLTRGPIAATLARLAGPMIVGIASVAVFGLVDTWFVSRLGGAELAALGFAFPVMMIVSSIAFGLGTGVTSALSRAVGAGDEARARRLTTDALLLAVAVVAVVAGAGMVAVEPLFVALGAGPEALPHVVEYMRIWFAGSVFLVVPMVGNAALRATGDTRTPALIMVAAGAMNAALDPLLIFGLGPLEGLGVAGAALASVIARAGTLVVSLYVLGRREGLLARQRPAVSEVLASWRAIVAVGAPAALTNLALPITMALVTREVAEHGAAAVAAFGAGGRVEMLAGIPALAVAAGMAPFAGQNHGAGQRDRVAAGLRLAVAFAVSWGLLAWLGLAAAAGSVAGGFSDDPAVLSALSSYLGWAPLGLGLLGALHVSSATFNAVGRPLSAASLHLGRVGLLLVLPAAGSAGWGLPGLFAGVAAANGLAGAVALGWSVVDQRKTARWRGASPTLGLGATASSSSPSPVPVQA